MLNYEPFSYKYKLKNTVFWDVTMCGSCKKRCFRRTYCFHHQSDKNQLARKVSSNKLINSCHPDDEGDTFL
jgi:hypothetical protein